MTKTNNDFRFYPRKRLAKLLEKVTTKESEKDQDKKEAFISKKKKKWTFSKKQSKK